MLMRLGIWGSEISVWGSLVTHVCDRTHFLSVALERLRQEDYNFKASVGNVAKPVSEMNSIMMYFNAKLGVQSQEPPLPPPPKGKNSTLD